MTFVLRANDATRDQVLANCKRFLDMLPAEKCDAFESFADHDNDRNAALRLCALKVAAMIGEGME